MRYVVLFIGFLTIVSAPDAGREALAMGATPLAQTEPAASQTPRVEVKLKCKLNKHGKLVCEKQDKPKGKCKPGQNRDPKTGVCFSCSHNDHFENGKCVPNKGSGSANKCKGPNNCGSGYRDLDAPNKYGACCEQVAAPPKDDGPKSGGCQKAEPNKHTLNCTPPFPARSCGALGGDGKMTCCCVK